MTPDAFTINESFLDVGEGHQLYIHDWGNKHAALPIIFLHGGPGGGCSDGHKTLFDGKIQRVVFFDQRGAGKSLPAGSLRHNTTDKLVNDIDLIADSLGLDKFVITGGSWGSCLALAYALKRPKRLKAMVLRGIFTGSQAEADYLDKGGFELFYPDVWEAYKNRTPEKHLANPSAFHYEQIKKGTPEEIKSSAYAYSELEGSLLKLDDRHTPEDFETFDPSAMTIELHYLGNNCFLPDKHIIDNAHKINTPTWLVQGRYDVVCPPKTAWDLSKKMPNAKLFFTTAGHSGSDRANYDVLRTLLLQITS